MSEIRTTATLRLDPRAIPAVRESLDESILELQQQLARLRFEGYVHAPWLGDETSAEVRTYYHERVMDSSDGPYAALAAYQAELMKVRGALVRMEEEYRRTDGENAAMWGRT